MSSSYVEEAFARAQSDMDLLWRESFRQSRADVVARIGRLERSLMSLKNQTSGYAESHRKLIAMYKDVLATIDKHNGAAP